MVDSGKFLLTAHLALVVAFIGATNATGAPVIVQVQNNYSFIQPELPNYGIAPGSLFVIEGTGLSTPFPPILQSSAAPGLPQALNQTSISVTVNGVTTVPSLYYTSATQVAAVLPSTTPVGAGTITVAYNGQTSAAAPIQVVQSALGLDTVYGIGTGLGVITDSNNALFDFTHPAQPGQTVVLWGSGVGPDLSNDDRTYPLNQNNLTNIPLQVYIGGISANVLYRGRSQYPGVDQVDVVIPAGVSPGCFVSIVAVTGSIVSNTVTIPVASLIGRCSDEGLSYSGNQFESLAAKTNVEVGTIIVGETLSPSGTTWSAGATFQLVQSGLYASGYGDASEGSCVVIPPASSTEGPFQSSGLDAGTIAITFPGGLGIMNEAPGTVGSYITSLAAGPPDPGSQGIQYSFIGTGGKDIPPFTSGLTLEWPPLVWTNQSSFAAINRSQGATVTWADSTSGLLNDIEISGSAVTATATGAPLTVGFSCHAPVEAGSFTIPPSILMALPAGRGTLNVEHTFNALYPANGPFDLFQAFGRVGPSSQIVTYN
jgi:uncharacterized protein (TIGR03437 family)